MWTYDFLTERTEGGRQFKLLVVLDAFTREALAIEVDRSFTVREVILTLQFLFCRAWSTAAHSIRQRPGVHRYEYPALSGTVSGKCTLRQQGQRLDFLAELTQHISNKGEYMIRYYGHYSRKARGIRAKHAAASQNGADQQEQRPGQCKSDRDQPIPVPPAPLRGRRWAMLIPAQVPRTLRPLAAAAIPWSTRVNPISPCG